MKILPFTPRHYVAYAHILTNAYGDYRFSAEHLRLRDESSGDAYLRKRWVGSFGGTPVAIGEYRHTPEMYHPQKFLLNIAVQPDHQGRGFGNSLYEHLLTDMAAYAPLSVRASCRADNVRSVAFLESRGFVRGMHILEQYLDLRPSALSLSYAIMQRALKAGVAIVTLPDMEADTDRNENLYSLITAIREEVPLPNAASHVSLDFFVDTFLNTPYRIPEATFIATYRGAYIGFSDLYEDGDGGLYWGLTGVRREYRRQGIASALKEAGLQFGRLHAYSHIKTFNAAENTAIRALNQQAGFQERFAWLHFEKTGQDRPAR